MEGMSSLVREELAVSEKPQGGASWVSGGYGKGPWFLFITPQSQSQSEEEDDPGVVRAFQIDPLNKRPAEISSVAVPKPFARYRLLNPLPRAGGGGHYLIIQNESYPKATTFHIIDPFSYPWTSLSRLPDLVPHFPNPFSILKAVTQRDSIDPGTPVVAIAQPNRHLIWTKVGESHHWRSLSDCLNGNLRYFFSDVIWRPRDNLFWAMLLGVYKVISFDFVSGGSGSGKTLEVQQMILDLHPAFNPDIEARKGWVYLRNSLFVDAPSGLFIVRWEKLMKQGKQPRKRLYVHKLLVNGADKTWKRVSSLDNYSFFLGSNNAIALSPADFPGLRSNHIYLPFNGRYPGHDFLERYGNNLYVEDLEVNLVHNLENRTWRPCNGAEAAWLVPFNRSPLQFAWVMPHTVPYAHC